MGQGLHESLELKLGIGKFLLRLRTGHNTRAGIGGGRMAVDEGRAQADEKLATATMIHPPAGPGVESARKSFEPGDGGDGGGSRRAADRRGWMQPLDQVEDVHAGGERGADGSVEMLDVGEPEQARLAVIFQFE